MSKLLDLTVTAIVLGLLIFAVVLIKQTYQSSVEAGIHTEKLIKYYEYKNKLLDKQIKKRKLTKETK